MQKKLLQVAKYNLNESYTIFCKQLKRTNGLVVKVGRCESGDLGLTPDKC